MCGKDTENLYLLYAKRLKTFIFYVSLTKWAPILTNQYPQFKLIDKNKVCIQIVQLQNKYFQPKLIKT